MNPAATPPRTAYTLLEVARSLGVSERQVRRYRDQGLLRAKRIGGRVVVPVGALAAFLDAAPDA